MNIILHLLHILFYGLCVLSALYQNGNVYFTSAVILTLIILGSISLKLKEDDDKLKNLITFILLAFSGIWLFYSLSERISSEILIVETLSLAGITFFLSNKSRDSAFRLIISFVLMIYACGKGHPLFIFFAIPSLLLIFPILYLSRLDSFCSKPEKLISESRYKLNYKYISFHVLVFLIIMGYLFYMFYPSNKNRKIIDTSHSGKVNSFSFDKIQYNNERKIIPESKNEPVNEVTDEPESGKDLFSLSNNSPGVKDNLKVVIGKIRFLWAAFSEQVKRAQGVLAVAIISIILLFCCSFPYIREFVNNIVKKYKCRNTYLKAKSHIENNPALCLKLCYLNVRDLLDLAGFPRKNNMELFEYGESLKKIDLNLSLNVQAVFSLYSKMVYSCQAVNKNDSKKAFEHLDALKGFVLINQKKEL